jgi:hypothetical protein
MATQWTAQGITSGAVLPAATLQSIGAVWVDYTPTLTQGVTVTKTVVQARYCQFQKTVIVNIMLNPTSTGTGGSALAVGLPIAARANNFQIIGSGFVYDNAPQFTYNVSAYLSTTTAFQFLYQGGNPWGVSPNLAIANGDQIQFMITYEVA